MRLLISITQLLILLPNRFRLLNMVAQSKTDSTEFLSAAQFNMTCS